MSVSAVIINYEIRHEILGQSRLALLSDAWPATAKPRDPGVLIIDIRLSGFGSVPIGLAETIYTAIHRRPRNMAESLQRDIGRAKALGQEYHDLERKLRHVQKVIADRKPEGFLRRFWFRLREIIPLP